MARAWRTHIHARMATICGEIFQFFFFPNKLRTLYFFNIVQLKRQALYSNTRSLVNPRSRQVSQNIGIITCEFLQSLTRPQTHNILYAQNFPFISVKQNSCRIKRTISNYHINCIIVRISRSPNRYYLPYYYGMALNEEI